MSVDLYQEEKATIEDIVTRVSYKWSRKTNTPENLHNLHRELVGRLEDAGFIAEVDVTTSPVVVSIVDRIEVEETDHDRIRYEVLQEKENE